MIIKNPLNQTVRITIKGKQLEVAPEGTIEVSKEEGEHWIKIHGFLRVEVDSTIFDSTTTVITNPEVSSGTSTIESEVQEEVSEANDEVEAEAPKKSKAKSKK